MQRMFANIDRDKGPAWKSKRLEELHNEIIPLHKENKLMEEEMEEEKLMEEEMEEAEY